MNAARRWRSFLLSLVIAVVAADLPAAAEIMTFDVRGNQQIRDEPGWSVLAEGRIDVGATARLRTKLNVQPLPPGTIVYFHSPGGSLSEALRLGGLIRERKLNTSIGAASPSQRIPGQPFHWIDIQQGICFSACAFAFLGGVERFAGKGLYGVHRFFDPSGRPDPDAMDRAQIMSAALLEFVRGMGADPALLSEMVKQGGAGMNILALDRLDALRVTTPFSQTRWEIVAENGAIVARGVIQDRDGRHVIEFGCRTLGLGRKELTMRASHFSRRLQEYVAHEITSKGLPLPAFRIRTKTLLVASGVVFQEFPLEDDAIIGAPQYHQGQLTAVIRVTPRILSFLETATHRVGVTFSIEGAPWHISSASVIGDYTNGRKMVLDFAKTCS